MCVRLGLITVDLALVYFKVRHALCHTCQATCEYIAWYCVH